jgi:hypothetical protein
MTERAARSVLRDLADSSKQERKRVSRGFYRQGTLVCASSSLGHFHTAYIAARAAAVDGWSLSVAATASRSAPA